MFGGQERWSTRKVGKKRKEPDLSRGTGRGDYGFTLGVFPQELWGCLDPEGRGEEWKGLAEDAVAWAGLPSSKRPGYANTNAGAKRKKTTRRDRLDFERFGGADEDGIGDGVVTKEEGGDSEDEDPVRGAGERKRARMEARRAGGAVPVGEKQGLEAEDDYERDINPEDEEEDGGEDEPVDSDFSEDEDAMNDYNAENYFDDGEDDMGDDGDGAGEEY